MSCTIIYKGKLKSEYTFNDMVSIVQKHAESIDCILNIREDFIEIRFSNEKSESLVLALQNNKIDGFCKWNGDTIDEYYKILDMFIELKPLFKQYKVEDDYGIWNEYLVQNKPCKVIKRSISTEQEQKLLNRIIDNKQKEYSDIEIELLDIMYHSNQSSPFSKNICRIVVQDFIELFDMKSLTSENRNRIIEVAKEVSGFNQYFLLREENFTFQLRDMVVAIWIDYYLSFKNRGIVRELPNETKGLESSKLAALFGILSNFLNCHSGTINSKHAEINKFMAKSISNDDQFVLSRLGADIELELLISVLDYLGFKYEGKP